MNQYDPTTTTSGGDFLQSTQCVQMKQLPYYPLYNSSGKSNQNTNFSNDVLKYSFIVRHLQQKNISQLHKITLSNVYLSYSKKHNHNFLDCNAVFS